MTPESLLPFTQYKTSRSSGAGGQNVNKVETRVTLLFDLENADIFTEDEKSRLKSKLANRILPDGTIQLSVQESRSQLQNKEIALEKLVSLITSALKTQKTRKPTKPSKSAVQARLDNKRRQALRKINRQRNWD